MPDESQGIYHRLGAPGGPEADVNAEAAQVEDSVGTSEDAWLLSAPKEASEVELLRRICSEVGVTWGRDESGWWAVVPSRLTGD